MRNRGRLLVMAFGIMLMGVPFSFSEWEYFQTNYMKKSMNQGTTEWDWQIINSTGLVPVKASFSGYRFGASSTQVQFSIKYRKVWPVLYYSPVTSTNIGYFPIDSCVELIASNGVITTSQSFTGSNGLNIYMWIHAIWKGNDIMGEHLFSTNELGYVVASNLVDAVNLQTESSRDIRVLLSWLIGLTIVVVVAKVWPWK